jgi:hypothetical protein
MAFDLILGQTKDDWSRDGQNGGRESPGRDAALGALMLGIGVAIAMVKAPDGKSEDLGLGGFGGNGDGAPSLPRNPFGGGGGRPRDDNDWEGFENERTTMEIPAFEPMAEVVGRRLR